jgi:hypothetical protein
MNLYNLLKNKIKILLKLTKAKEIKAQSFSEFSLLFLKKAFSPKKKILTQEDTENI